MTLALDSRSLGAAGGVVLGRSVKLVPPGGFTVAPAAEDVRLVNPGLCAAKVLSRKHTRLTAASPADGRCVWVEDMGSTNGTVVGSARIRPGEKRRLGLGDTLHLGLPGFKVSYTLTDDSVLPVAVPAAGDFKRAVASFLCSSGGIGKKLQKRARDNAHTRGITKDGEQPKAAKRAQTFSVL